MPLVTQEVPMQSDGLPVQQLCSLALISSHLWGAICSAWVCRPRPSAGPWGECWGHRGLQPAILNISPGRGAEERGEDAANPTLPHPLHPILHTPPHAAHSIPPCTPHPTPPTPFHPAHSIPPRTLHPTPHTPSHPAHSIPPCTLHSTPPCSRVWTPGDSVVCLRTWRVRVPTLSGNPRPVLGRAIFYGAVVEGPVSCRRQQENLSFLI